MTIDYLHPRVGVLDDIFGLLRTWPGYQVLLPIGGPLIWGHDPVITYEDGSTLTLAQWCKKAESFLQGYADNNLCTDIKMKSWGPHPHILGTSPPTNPSSSYQHQQQHQQKHQQQQHQHQYHLHDTVDQPLPPVKRAYVLFASGRATARGYEFGPNTGNLADDRKRLNDPIETDTHGDGWVNVRSSYAGWLWQKYPFPRTFPPPTIPTPEGETTANSED